MTAASILQAWKDGQEAGLRLRGIEVRGQLSLAGAEAAKATLAFESSTILATITVWDRDPTEAESAPYWFDIIVLNKKSRKVSVLEEGPDRSEKGIEDRLDSIVRNFDSRYYDNLQTDLSFDPDKL